MQTLQSMVELELDILDEQKGQKRNKRESRQTNKVLE